MEVEVDSALFLVFVIVATLFTAPLGYVRVAIKSDSARQR